MKIPKLNLQFHAATTPVEFPLANIARVEIETEEEVPKQYRLTDVASEAEVTAFVSSGQEQELRVKNTIKAQNKTEDIVKGYDVKLVSATMVPEILALVDGGTWDAVGKKYTAPIVGTPVNRTPFTMHIYTEEKDVNGETKSYVKFSYKHCKGTPVNYSLVDGQFYAPELTAKSRPKMGESPVEFIILDKLPA